MIILKNHGSIPATGDGDLCRSAVCCHWQHPAGCGGAGFRNEAIEAIYERGEVKRAGAENLCPGSPRTSPSPSASVDLAHLRPRPRSPVRAPPAHIP